MASKHNGFIPKEMYLLTAKMKDTEQPIRWRMCSPEQIKVSFTMYYEGGQWRYFIATYNLETFDYVFSCTYYYPDNRKPMGREITKEEWDSMGHSVSNSKNTAGEIIPPNDPDCLNWLERKGLLVKIQPENAEVISINYKLFEQEAREHLEAGKEFNKQELKILVQERIRMSKNIEQFNKYLESIKTSSIIDLNNICFLEAQNMNQMKTNQIDPEQIIQLKNTFYGVINASPI